MFAIASVVLPSSPIYHPSSDSQQRWPGVFQGPSYTPGSAAGR